MNPSPPAVASIRALVAAVAGGFAGNTDAQLVAALNAPAVANPAPQGQVGNPIEESALFGLLTDPANGSLGKLLAWPNLGLLKADIEAANVVGLQKWCAILPGSALVTAAEAQSVAAYVAGTTPDPSYRSQVGRAEAAIGRPVDAADLAAARSN